MEINQEKIQEAIVAQAVGHFINDNDLYERVKKGVEARIDAMFADKVRELVGASIESAYKDGFEREYTKRDGFGRPTGNPTSISKELERIISGYWQDQVDSSGKRSTGGYNTVSRAEWMMTKLCADDFGKEMKQHVVNVGGALKDHFRGVLNQHVTLMLSEVFHVQTETDKVAKNSGRACIDPLAKPIGAA